MSNSNPRDVAEMARFVAALGLSPQELMKAALSGDPSILESRMGRGSSSSGEEIESEMVAQAKYVKQNFERERAMVPQRVVGASRSTMFGIWTDHLKSHKEKQELHMILRAYVGAPKSFSVTPLSRLDKIYFNEMMTPFVHKGNFLLCRIVSPPVVKIAVEFLAEDQNGDIKHVALYYIPFLGSLHPDDIDIVLPIGTPLVIREPFLKYPLQGGLPFIRVDSPSDVVFPHPEEDIVLHGTWKCALPKVVKHLPSSPLEWKEVGNRIFLKGRYHPAAVAYTRGLASATGADRTALLSNRAQAYLKLGWYLPALTDANAVLVVTDISPELRRKVQLRAGVAQYQRGNYDEARHFFEAASRAAGDDSLCKEWLGKCADRMREASGEYDWLHIFRLTHANSASREPVDLADFMGPIRVSLLPPAEGGRGMVATRDVKAGELLLVSKAFVTARSADMLKNMRILLTNLITKRGKADEGIIALRRLVDRVCGDTEAQRLVTQLCPAPPYPSPSSSYPPSGTPVETCGDPLQPCTDIDIGLLESIYSNNCFAIGGTGTSTESDSESEGKDGSALFLLPSLFNHSCTPNASRTSNGDHMIIRALVDIPAGDQVFVIYAFPRQAHQARVEILENWNVTCNCVLCTEERSERASSREKRASLLKKWDAEWPGYLHRHDVRAIRKLLSSLQETCPKGHAGALRTTCQVHHALAACLQAIAFRVGGGPRSDALYVEAVVEEMRSLEAVGFTILDWPSSPPRPTASRLELPIEPRVPEQIKRARDR